MEATEVREDVERNLRQEVFGPTSGDPVAGNSLDVSMDSVTFDDLAASKGRWFDSATKQEILTGMSPKKRFGVGVLHPIDGEQFGGAEEDQTNEIDDIDVDVSEYAETHGDAITELTSVMNADDLPAISGDDFDLSETQSRRPSALGLTGVLSALSGGEDLVVSLTGATYRKLNVNFRDDSRERTWWVREPFELTGRVPTDTLIEKGRGAVQVPLEGPTLAQVEVAVHVRRQAIGGGVYATAVVSNRAARRSDRPEIYQVDLGLTLTGPAEFVAYGDESESEDKLLIEESAEIELIYRGRRAFAVGHGCAASWQTSADSACRSISTDALPSFETYGITPDVRDGHGNSLAVRMRDLAAASIDEVQVLLSPILDSYESWIRERESEVDELPSRHRDAAERLVNRAKSANGRMRRGLNVLRDDAVAFESFRKMNEAMADQQQNVGRPLLGVRGSAARPSFEQAAAVNVDSKWRPFQIGFLLLSVAGLLEANDEDREIVDLIFFPTGGGKTEAYLGAAAFYILSRRNLRSDGGGVSVMMRYTLRLLSTQQFQRSAALICALELIRRADEAVYGPEPISLGLWVGAAVSPNKRSDALARLSKLKNHPLKESNPFLLDKCPHCGAQMGVVKDLKIVVGYEAQGGRVAFVCMNRNAGCPFSNPRQPLPVYLVDEDIYKFRPTMIIATVDKFAMMSRRPSARAIFNLGADGSAISAPPGLIIQDELHLISGPLGSMVGLYEPIIEELCSEVTPTGVKLKPKIIGATATIRRYESQITALYGRASSAIFPPLGLSADESFFASIDRDESGVATPARRYVGVYAAGFKSMQTTQVRVAAALSQAPSLNDPESSSDPTTDPYWTSIWFFNSLRELGNTVSLVQSDIPDYLTGMLLQGRVDKVRWPRKWIELTSRRESDKIPEALRALELERDSKAAIDMCLASSIMEVGVDVPRLSLLSIVGQPKTTAQYIQVSGRVGRRGKHAPGLVVTLYSTMRARDRSHYERFRPYHETLYAQVEPGSVTPFAIPTLKRALHGPIISYIRMKGSIQLKPSILPSELFTAALEILVDRCLIVDPQQVADVKAHAEQFRQLWQFTTPDEWDYDWAVEKHYGAPKTNVGRALMRGRSEPISLAGVPDQSKMTPTSMREVDAETLLITGGNPYLRADMQKIEAD